MAEGPDQYRAVAKVFDDLKRQEKTLDTEVRHLENGTRYVRDIDTEIATALAGLDRLNEHAAANQHLPASDSFSNS